MANDQVLCPACGGKIVQEKTPECPYCGHGLGGPALERNPLGDRLAKMSEHDSFAGLMTVSPIGDEASGAIQRISMGGFLAFSGVVLLSSTWGTWSLAVLLPAGLLAAAGLLMLFRGLGARAAATKGELKRRPAIVIDRRSETAFNGWSGRVTYFFTLEFEDGLQGEFRFPGRGWPHEPLARGATGLAYTRGTNLLEFTNLKV